MRKFLPKFIILFSFLLGSLGLYSLLIFPHITGDLASMCKLPIGKSYEDMIHQKYPFDTKYVALWSEEMKINEGDVIVFGDSFSNRTESSQWRAGTENSWTRYTAEKLGIRIVNFRNYDCGIVPEKLFISAINNNVIPKNSIVVIESVERHLKTRLTSSLFDDNDKYWKSYVSALYDYEKNHTNKKKKDWLVETATFIRCNLGGRSPAHKYHLSRPCFSHSCFHSLLLSFEDDENNIEENTELTIPILRNAIDSIFYVAQQHNIKLFYMIAADKYDAYESLILEEHKTNHMLDYFSSNDSIINTKELLLPYIQSGVKDIYRLDDTHWSPIGSKIVGEEVAKRIKDLYLSQE